MQKRLMKENIDSKIMMYVVLSIGFMAMLNNSVVTPLLADIGQTYPNVSDAMLQQVVTLPSLAIIVTILLLPKMNKRLTNKQIICTGLIIFIISAILLPINMPFKYFLLTRLFLGIGVGLINPFPNMLSVIYFTGDNQTKMMGYTSMIRVVGAIVGSLLTGFIALYSWHLSFSLYCLAIVPLALVIMYMDNDKIENKNNNKKIKFKNLNKSVKILLVFQGVYVLINFIFITNIALYLQQTKIADPELSAILMVCSNIVSVIMSANFFVLYKKFDYKILYIAFIAMFLAIVTLISLPSFVMIFVAAFLFGAPMGILSPLIVREITNVIDDKKQITGTFSLLSLAVFGGQFMTPIISSVFSNVLNVTGAVGSFEVDLLLIVLYFVCMVLYFEFYKKKTNF